MNLAAQVHPIQRRTLHDELVERIRQMIHSEELPAGSKIPEKELCERMRSLR